MPLFFRENVTRRLYSLTLGGFCMAAAISLSGDRPVRGGQPEATPQTYGETKDYLSRHTSVVELSDRDGAGWQSARRGRAG